MKLIGKHLLRTVRLAPLQPLLIVLTVICSVAIAVSAMRIPSIFDARAEEEIRTASEVGDLRITVRADSASRLLFCEDAKAVLGGDGDVLGEFRLTGFSELGGERCVLSVSAVDFQDVDAFYRLEYLSYGRFDAQNLKRSVIVSSSFAEEYGVRVGDALELCVLDETHDLTVQAVARDKGVLTEAQVLISDDLFLSVLTERVPMIAGLGTDVQPCNRLLIRLSDGVSESVVSERFSSSPAFADKTVESVDAVARSELNLLIQRVSLWIPAILLLLLSVLLVVSSLRLLRLQRQTEAALFRATGASPRQLDALEICECLLYALLGGIGGVLLSRPIVAAASKLFWWQIVPPEPDRVMEALGLLWALILMVGTAYLQICRQKRRPLAMQLQGDEIIKPRSAQKGRMLLLLAGLFAISCGISFALPIRLRIYSAIGMLFLLIGFLFFFVPCGLRWETALLTRLLQKRKRPLPALEISVKSIQNSAFLQHVGRLLTLLFAFLMTLGTVTLSFARQNTTLSAFVTAEIACLHGDAETAEQLCSHPATTGVCRVGYYRYVVLPNGVSVGGISVSGDASACLDGNLLPEVQPVGDAVVLSVGVARLTGASVGDIFSMTVNGIAHDYRVSEILDTHLPLVMFDADTVGLERELLLVRASGDQPQLHALIEERGGISVSPDLLFRDNTDLMDRYLSLICWALPTAAVMAMAGSLNLWTEQFRARRRERAILCENGCTRKGVLRQQSVENALLLLSALLTALPFAWLMCRIIDFGIASFGVALIS